MRIELTAIKYDGYIYVGLRHAWIRDFMFEFLENIDRLDFVRNFQSGFITNTGEYIDRDKALEIALFSGQVKTIIGGDHRLHEAVILVLALFV